MDDWDNAAQKLVWDSQLGTFTPPDKYTGKPRFQYLKGPVPIDWLARAAESRGRALVVGLAVWTAYGMAKGALTFPLRSGLVRAFRLSRWQYYRGLRELEQAGLVAVERHRGKAPTVWLLQVGEP
jgi:hypothetical protein